MKLICVIMKSWELFNGNHWMIRCISIIIPDSGYFNFVEQ